MTIRIKIQDGALVLLVNGSPTGNEIVFNKDTFPQELIKMKAQAFDVACFNQTTFGEVIDLSCEIEGETQPVKPQIKHIDEPDITDYSDSEGGEVIIGGS